jgi:putative DNA primase/helicase
MKDKAPLLDSKASTIESLQALSLETAPRFYAELLGWPIFPVQGLSGTGDDMKAPLPGSRGFKDASSDPETVSRLWRRGLGKFGAGVATGDPLGLWVLDIDADPTKGKKGIETISALIERHGSLPETLTGRTGSGGWHLFFRMPEGREVRNSTSQVGEDLDVRGTVGYVVLPPSPHASGTPYAWKKGRGPGEIEPASAPDWLLELAAPSTPAEPSLLDAPSEPRNPLAWNVTPREGRPAPVDPSSEDWPAHALAVLRRQIVEVLSAEVGTRRLTLAKATLITGRLAARGVISEAQIVKALTEAARIIGLEDHIITQTIRSGLAAGKRGPNV